MRNAIASAKAFILRHPTASSFGAAFLGYTLLSLFYMGGALTSCTESLLTFPGDNTAGMIALFSMDSNDPWWGHSNTWSFPYGESLGQPTHITAQVTFIPFWLLAKLFGPICAFNLLSYIGFVSAALVTFGFVRWLLKGKFLVALIAGFAVAFTPYLQIKTGVHISYVFEGLFVAAIWLFLYFWRAPNWKRAALLGLSVASFAYTDGYFILLGGVLMGTLIPVALLYEYFASGRKLTPLLLKKIKLLVVGIAAAIAVILPVVYVQLTSAGQINSLLANSRDAISREAQVYGARPQEYLLPNAMNPITSPLFGTYYERDNHGSNPGENVLSLSLVMIGFAAYFVVRVIQGARQRKKLKVFKNTFDPLFIVVIFGAVLIVAFIFSLPPKAGPLPLPSYALTEVVSLWRVLARLAVIVNIALVTLAACGLVLFLERFKENARRILVCAIIFALVFLEYLTFTPPRPVYGYDRVPQLYSWLHEQEKYKEIAEYPLYEFATSHFPVFYNTYQRVHGKKMLNGAVSEEMPYFARQAVRDLNEPQSVPALRTLGIDFVVVHSPVFPGEIPGLKFIKDSPEKIIKTDGKSSHVWGYEVLPGEGTAYAVAPVEGFHAPVIESPVSETLKMGHEGVLRVRRLNTGSNVQNIEVNLRLLAINEAGQIVSIKQDGREIWRGVIPADRPTQLNVAVDPAKNIHIQAIDPTTDATLLMPSVWID